jgi:integrase/recombinase XerC
MAPFLFVQDFIAYLKIEKRFSVHTLGAYEKDLVQFMEFGSFESFEEIKSIRSTLIRSWIVELMDQKLNARSVNRKLSSLRSFFKWMKKNGWINDNPIAKISGPKTAKKLPQFAKESELSSLDSVSYFTDDFDGHRDHLMIEFFYQTGIRLSELINLKVSDVNDQSIRVLGKRNKERLVPISKELYELFRQYMNLRQSIRLCDENVFVLNNGNKLYPKFVYRRINNYLSSVTSLDKCSPHVLRHTFATHMLNNGAGLETLKDLLGHANLSATQVYTHNSFAQLNAIYSQAHPRGH